MTPPHDDQLEGEEFEDGESGDLPVITLKSRDVSVALDAPAARRERAPVTPAPHPEEPFMVRHRWWLLGGAIALAVLAVVLVYLLLFRDTSKSQAVEVLIEPSAAVTNISADVGNSTSVAAFNRAARSVSRAQASVDAARQSAQEISDDQVRAQTLALLDAEDALLSAYDDLGSVNRLESSASADAADQVDEKADEVGRAVAALQALGLEEAPHPYPNLRYVSGAVHSLNRQMGD